MRIISLQRLFSTAQSYILMFYVSENNVKVSYLLVNVIYPYLMTLKNV